MKKDLLVLFLIISFLSPAALAQKSGASALKPTQTAAAPVPAYEIPIVSKTLANGMQIIVLPDASVPLVTIELAVRNGSFTEPPELNGLSHLYEHMFFKPNQAFSLVRCEYIQQAKNFQAFRQFDCDAVLKLRSKITDTSYLETIDQQIPVSPNGTTHEEVVEYFVTATTPSLVSAMKYIRDATRYPTFNEDEFAREKQVVIGELDRNMSNPFYYLNRAMMDKLFYKYPTRKSPGGTRETVAAATTDQMRLIQSRYYVPNNSALVVTGDVQPENVFTLAGQLFGDWPQSEDPFKKFPLVEHPPLTKSEGAIIDQPVQNVTIQIGWHGPSVGRDDAATYAADVFSYILNQPNSRFQRKLVDTGLATSVGFNYYTQKNVGPISVLIQTTPENARAAVAALYAEIAQFDKPDYFTNDELENAKTLLDADDLYRREKLSDYSHIIAFWWSTSGIDYFRGYHKNLRAITRADISRYIKTYIHGKPHIGLALMSPEQQTAAKLTPLDLTGGAQ